MFQKIIRFSHSLQTAVFIILIFSIQSYSAVTVDNSATEASSATPATLTWMHNVGTGNSRALYVTLTRYDADTNNVPPFEIGNPPFTSVTFNSTPMQFIGYFKQDNNSVQFFRIFNPASGNGAIQVTFATAFGTLTQYSVGTSVSFFGVDQDSSLGTSLTTQTEQGSPSTTPSVEISGTEIGDMVLDVVTAPPAAGLFTPGMDQTKRGSGNFTVPPPLALNLGGNADVGATSTKSAATLNTTTSWTLDSASTWINGGVAVKSTTTTAALGTISGRVLSGQGRGIPRVIVTMTGGNGVNVSVRTNQFGYYRFEDLEVGNTYILQANSKLYSFAPQVINFNESLTNLNLFPISNGFEKINRRTKLP